MATMDDVLSLVNQLDDKLQKEHRGLYTLALQGLDGIKEHEQMEFIDQFGHLQTTLNDTKLAVAFTCYVLRKFGCTHVSSLEQHASSDFQIADYPKVDLRLEVAAFLYDLDSKLERPKALSHIKIAHLNHFNKTVTVSELVQIMCKKGVVEVGTEISTLDKLAGLFQRPSFFNAYRTRCSHRPVTPSQLSGLPVAGQDLNQATADLGMEIVKDTAGFVPVGTGRIMYCKGKMLGKCSDGAQIFLGCLTKDKRKVAVKRLSADNHYLALTEMNVLRTLKHDNIIQYFDDEITEDFRYLALEYCLGSLRQYVEGGTEELKDVPVDEKTRKALLQDALKGLHHLHEHQIIHRDLKPEDILLTRKSTASTEVKAVLGDFGRSWEVKDGHCFVNEMYRWIAPELLKACTFAVDIYAMGCVIYYVLTGGKHPFGVKYFTNVTSESYTVPELTDGVVDRETVEHLIILMIAKDRDSRPSAKQVLNHCYFWPNDKRLNFLEAVSNFIDKRSCPELEENAGNVVGPSGWFDDIDDALLKDLKGRNFNKDSVISLLKAIRNKKQHYAKLPENIRDLFGDSVYGFLTYFTSHFPSLLIHTYQKMESYGSEELLKQYYPFTCTQRSTHTSTSGGTVTSSPPVEQDPIDINLIMDKIPELPHLMKMLRSIKNCHASLADNLGVDRPDPNPNDDSAPLGAVLRQWRSNKGKAATWTCIIGALEVMGHQNVIDNIIKFLQDEKIFDEYKNQ